MNYLLVWFYECCLRLRDFDNARVTPYTAKDLPTKQDIEWLDAQFHARTGNVK